MLIIVDNGKGAQEIARFVRTKNQIVKPKNIPDKASGYILSDGSINKESQKVITKLIHTTNVPVLGIGAGYAYIAAVYGAKIKETKMQPHDRITIQKSCTILLDMKKSFTVKRDCKYCVEELPENFSSVAHSAKYEFEIIQEMEKPFFGVHFNPELGMDGIKIIDNFVKFLGIWEKYHK